MEKNKTGKYFKYAIGEIVLVVIGILIALQINNWNENRKLDSTRENYHRQLLVDLETDKNYAERMISTLDSSISKYNDYRETYTKSNISFSKAFENIGENSFATINLEFKTRTIKSLISTGDIKLLEHKLRDKLTMYSGSIAQAVNLSIANNEDSNNMLQFAMMHGGDALVKFQGQPDIMNALAMKNRMPEIFLETEAYLTWKIFGENVTIQLFNEIIKEADIIIELISNDLEEK